jgi:kinesin family protein 5
LARAQRLAAGYRYGVHTQRALRAQYNEVAASTVDDILAGYNGTIFAYGQTGAGKSWSMMGPDLQMRGMEGFDHSLGGIIPRSTEDIFEKIQRTEGSEFTVQVSYLEVYRETVKDLLDPTKTNLSVREGKGHNFYVEGLTEEYVTDAEDVLDALKRGDENRAVAATKMNAVSSRSHSVFMMKVNQRKLDDGSTKSGQLNLVDLAGSEKIQSAHLPWPPSCLLGLDI